MGQLNRKPNCLVPTEPVLVRLSHGPPMVATWLHVGISTRVKAAATMAAMKLFFLFIFPFLTCKLSIRLDCTMFQSP